MTTITIDRAVVQQALHVAEHAGYPLALIKALRAALAQEQADPVATSAENATTQQRVGETPPSDYRRGYWDGFAVGKREGRIEAEDAAKQAEPAWVCPDSAEHRYKQPGHCEDCGKTLVLAQAEPVQEPVAYTTGHCKERAKPGGCQLHNLHCGYPKCDRKSAQEQAEPVQEPVGWLESPHGAFRANPLYKMQFPSQLLHWQIALYTAPPKAEPLTDEEIEACRQQGYDHDGLHSPFDFREAARAIERALEKKNGR